MTDTLPTSNPRDGITSPTAIRTTTGADVREACARAQASAPLLEKMGRKGRASMLNALADSLENNRGRVIAAADSETALGETRLHGELTRTAYQFRLFAEALAEGSYLEATIDSAGPTEMGPRPDLRRMLVPIGAVGVFGSSNFPFAFSVPGGDTASALAAGCPVVVKAHGAHPLTSQYCFDALRAGLHASEAPEDAIQIVYGRQAGIDLVADPDIHAVGFTGSLSGGKALLQVIEARNNPIPFYGELSGLNPLIVSPEAADERGSEIGTGLVASFTLGAGQFCTKPGLAFIPSSTAGDKVVETMISALDHSPVQYLLTSSIASSYSSLTSELAAGIGVTHLASGDAAEPNGFAVTSQLFSVDAKDLTERLTKECFGPTSLIIRYSDQEDLIRALHQLESSLTTTIHCSESEVEFPRVIEQFMRDRTGRFVFNDYPTGVSVAWAQHHGGPWPSTNSLHTSVGVTAVRRFLRPVAWQSAPQELLPLELRDDYSSIPRRVDGSLVLPRGNAAFGT